MSAPGCVDGTDGLLWPLDGVRRIAHARMEMALAEVQRRRAAGILAVTVQPLEETWPAYFRRHHQEKDATTQAKAEMIAPGPEHTSRDPWPEGFALPAGAASLVKLAEAAGWLVETRYARGSVVTQRKTGDGTMARVVERRHSVAVRAWDPARNLHAVAVWEAPVEAVKLAWKSELAKTWKVGEFPLEVGVNALKALVKETAA